MKDVPAPAELLAKETRGWLEQIQRQLVGRCSPSRLCAAPSAHCLLDIPIESTKFQLPLLKL